MGEVYHARDTKLHRDVALKILPAAFTHDADRLARFQREAQVLASLNHPNIAAIYGFEESRSGGSSDPTTNALVLVQRGDGIRRVVVDVLGGREEGNPVRRPAVDLAVQFRVLTRRGWLAYTLRTSGTANIWVEPFPATGANRYQVTTINGHHPVWLPRGEGLSFRVGNSEQVVVPITVAPSFSIGNQIPVVGGGLPLIGVGVSRPYDVTRDGRRFVVVAPAFRGGTGVVSIPEIEIIVNWFEDLKRRVPVP
jgi:hypothetical protein